MDLIETLARDAATASGQNPDNRWLTHGAPERQTWESYVPAVMAILNALRDPENETLFKAMTFPTPPNRP
jgi:hypothetical protein